MSRESGRYVETTTTGEIVRAFVPGRLPPTAPALDMAALNSLVQLAEHSLGRLDLASEIVPSMDWFVYAFARKEAVLSSQIEGTQATLIDLLKFEAGHAAPALEDDIDEVFNYLAALKFARAQLHDPRGLPLSQRLLNEAHRLLLRGVQGSTKQPGEVRRSQNWIGGTRPGNARFVPPPPEHLADLLGDLEQYIHTPDVLPPLVRAGLLHVQFETIHPYLDGNGRMGRLLITLLLEHWNLLRRPVLYLSLYFKRHRSVYYERLNAVRHGDWESWVSFFLEGVREIAEEATMAAQKLSALTQQHHRQLLGAQGATVVSIRLLQDLPRQPIFTIPKIAARLGVTRPAAAKAVGVLERLGMLVETTGLRRDRSYTYAPYLAELRIGTELSE